jgi:hypothetical protein
MGEVYRARDARLVAKEGAQGTTGGTGTPLVHHTFAIEGKRVYLLQNVP